MMHATSRASRDRLLHRLGGLLSSGEQDQRQLAEQLYAAAAVLVTQPRLRRTLGDPATDADGRARLAHRLFDGRISTLAAELVAEASAQRWSSPWDLTDSLELLADDALLAAAEQQGRLEEVEDELFRFERILNGEPRLATVLDDHTAAAERRAGLLRQLLEGKASPLTVNLLEHAVTSGRRQGIERSIDVLLDAAAARRSRSVARVISAVELSPAQQSRLVAALTELYGRAISVRTAVEPAVQGGLVIRIGDEVIDGSIAAQLANARAALSS